MATAVVIGLAVTAALNAAHIAAWWVIPLIVIVILRVSVQRSKRPKDQHSVRRTG